MQVRRFTLWLIAICLTAAWWLWLVPACYPAVTIQAPPGPVPVDRFVVLAIQGAKDTPQVLLAPKGSEALIDISVGQPTLVFRAGKAGTYEVVVVASRARVIPDDCYARCLILVGEQPDPKPDPDPQPTPVAKLLVQCIWEKRDGPPLPGKTYLLFHSEAVEEWIDDGGHDLERLDVDALRPDDSLAVDPRPDKLPIVRLLDADTGRILWEGMPEDEAGFLALLRTYKKAPSFLDGNASAPSVDLPSPPGAEATPSLAHPLRDGKGASTGEAPSSERRDGSPRRPVAEGPAIDGPAESAQPNCSDGKCPAKKPARQPTRRWRLFR